MNQEQYDRLEEAGVIPLRIATIHRIDSRAASDERRAQSLVRNAWAAFRSDLQDAAVLSDLMRERLLESLEAVSDHIPSDQAWDEKINDLRRGYDL